MPYEPRNYRKIMQSDRFESFVVNYKETDLWIGVPPKCVSKDLKKFVLEKIKQLRYELDFYIKNNENFQNSLTSIPMNENIPISVKTMINASQKTGIGPMSAVAGYFSEYIGNEVKKKFGFDEIVIENGGDIFLDIKEELILTIYAGKSPLTEKIGVKIDPKYSPLGICTSSGTVGHSLSFGKADAVMIACKNTSLADSYATAFCNRVKSIDDINKVLKQTEISEILSAIIIYDDKIGVQGKFEIIVF